MAPRKRKADGDGVSVTERVTRSSSRLANANSVAKQQPDLPEKKKAKPTKSNKGKAKPMEKVEKVKETETEATKTIVIEHCKQCTQFKIRAIKVKEGLEKAVPGIAVMLNPDKPRRGCFEIREDGGDTFISLLDMKRPFGPMKALDMDQVVSDIVEKVK